MSWSEAFKRAVIAMLWMMLFIVIGGIIIGIGMGMGGFDAISGDWSNLGGKLGGIIIVLIGYVGIIFASMAVYIKILAEAVTDTVVKRLTPVAPAQPPQTPKY